MNFGKTKFMTNQENNKEPIVGKNKIDNVTSYYLPVFTKESSIKCKYARELLKRKYWE